MKKLFQTNFFVMFMITPLAIFGQEDGDFFRDTDPPPTPIDDYVISFAFVAILIAAYYFYKINLKTETK